MTLLADAGSTKTRWIYKESSRTVLTEGINATQITSDTLNSILSQIDFSDVTSIHFYGAGCIGGETNDKIITALYRASHCSDITVQSDIVGAAVGTLSSSAGIVCILGTGANSALWNGSEVVSKIDAGGFILGDEGSGAVIGRTLISDFVKGLTPDWLTDILRNDYNLNYSTIVQRVYHDPMPNRWLASFATLLGGHRDKPYVHSLITSSFRNFAERNICRYPGWQSLSCAFVGSIAFYFQSELREVCDTLQIRISSIQKEPFV